MPRPQFTLRALLFLMLVAGCFFGGIRFERERQRREDEAAALAAKRIIPPKVNGVVLAARANELVEISLGSDDGLRKAHKLTMPPSLVPVPSAQK